MSRLFVSKPAVLALAVAFSGSAWADGGVWEGGICRPGQTDDTAQSVKSSGGETLPENVTRITADKAAGQSNVRARAEGDVIIERNGETLNADWADYEQSEQTVRAGDRFTLTRADGSTVRGKTLQYNLESGAGSATDTEFAAEHQGRRLQGTGEELKLADKQRYQAKNVKFNTCNPGDHDWYIQAGELNADQTRNVGVAKNARLVFGGVPVLYTPWVDFPLNGGRKSGFLVPTVSIGSDGTAVEVPYYFNLAPNYDLTLTPSVISSRGAAFGGEFRYLQEKYSGSLNGRYMPRDSRRDRNNRYEVDFKHRQKFNTSLSGGIDYHQVSDDDYYRDFYGRNEIAENIQLNRRAWLDYEHALYGGTFSANLTAQKYQTLSDSTGNKFKPYALLPRLSARWQKNAGKAQIDIYAQATRFSHDDLQSGSRAVLYPSVKWDFHNAWGYLRPKVGVHGTYYRLDGWQGEQARTVSRVLPIANLDAGMTFERMGKKYVQTLEPRLFYSYIKSRAQNDLPNFDTSENSFSYEQLFRENIYSGQDRINASNSLAVGLQTRLLDKDNGAERFRAGIGQKFYFTDDNVLLNGEVDKTPRGRSDWIAFAGGEIGKGWYADGSLHYNQNIKHTQRVDAGVRYNPEPGKVISVRAKYGRNEEIYTGFYGRLKQVDIAAQWPIRPNLYAVGRLNYSLSPNRPLEQTLGLEYKSSCGCWSASVVAQRYVTGLGSSKNALFFVLQLKDLSNIGKNPYEQLKLGIPGYSKTNEVFHQ